MFAEVLTADELELASKEPVVIATVIPVGFVPAESVTETEVEKI